MNVDDAFRKLMGMGEMEGLPPEGGVPAEGPATAAPPDMGSGYGLTGEAAPATVAAPPEPSYPPLDLDAIQRIERFDHNPIDPRSQIAEEYRKLRTRIFALGLAKPSLLLTSCHHNEGKTSTALNLALSMANRRESRILLLDLDLRRPRLRRFLGLPRGKADVVNVIRGDVAPEKAILYSESENLYFLGSNQEKPQASEYLQEHRLRELMGRLHASFDFVIADTSPCTSTSDPAIIGPHVGGLTLIVRCLHTQRESIQHAITSLNEVGVPTVGVVLSFVRFFLPRPLYRYQYYHGYYYFHGSPEGEEQEEASLLHPENGEVRV